MTEVEMTPDVFTVDYVGEPGKRAFYMQSRTAHGTFSYLLEKEQVSALGERLRELLLLIDEKDTVASATPARDPALALEEPVEPQWRVGTMGLAYDEDRDRVVVFASPVDASSEEDVDEDEGVRFILRRDQIRALVLHCLAIVSEGRPICQLCGLPMDPEGHLCPASNGHHIGT